MSFNLKFPAQNGQFSQLQLEPGEMIFVLGANGSGKSSLMFYFTRQNQPRVRKIAAHRQTWLRTDSVDMTPAAKVWTEQQLQKAEKDLTSRFRENTNVNRPDLTIYELINAENILARKIAAGVVSGDMVAAQEAAKIEAPISVVNELLCQSNIPIAIRIRDDGRIVAKKEGFPEYGAAELSDGERNALLIAGDVLTAPRDTLLIIDEPERHLHRSIISPLLSNLFERRPDCGFVVSTHDHDLPLEVHGSRTLLLRSCDFNGRNVQSWEADELPSDRPIDDILKRDLLGARRKILFVEGTESSLDKPLYSLIFPMVSVIPKGSCRDVELAVAGIRESDDLHWLRAFGIVDGDGYAPDQIQEKRDKGVYALPYYSVEAIYFYPKIIKWIASLQADVSGKDASEMTQRALSAGISAIKGQTDRLSEKVAKKSVRKRVLEKIPNDDTLLEGLPINIQNDANAICSERKSKLDAALAGSEAESNWQTILTMCPVRESSALADISAALDFRRVEDYERGPNYAKVPKRP